MLNIYTNISLSFLEGIRNVAEEYEPKNDYWDTSPVELASAFLEDDLTSLISVYKGG